jgi:hypothetical protein
MALAVISTGLLRLALSPQLRDDDARWVLLVLLVVLHVVPLGCLVLGDPGRIDRQKRWIRVLRDVWISVITLTNATAAGRLITAIVERATWTDDAKVLLGAGQRCG